MVRAREEIFAAVQEVEEAFPFEDYIDEDKRRHTAEIIDSVMKAVGNLESPKLLDIGCGPMNITAGFAKCGFRCFAADDLSDPWHLVGDNRRKIEDFARSMRIEFYLQDASYRIPFENETFDVVLLNSVIEHLHESPRELLNAAFGFLKTGGVLLVTMPNSVNLRKRIRVLSGRSNYPSVRDVYSSRGTWRGHVREYTLAETEYILKAAGGEPVLSKTCHMAICSRIPNTTLRHLYRVVTWIVPRLRDGILVIARKPPGWRTVQTASGSR